MQFLRECAARLDAGAPAAEVLGDMRARYTTPRCMNVKTCLVRAMCAPSAEYVAAVRALVVGAGEGRGVGAGGERAGAGDGTGDEEAAVAEAVRADRPPPWVDAAAWRALPPRLGENARALRIPRAEMVECKRLGVRALKKTATASASTAAPSSPPRARRSPPRRARRPPRSRSPSSSSRGGGRASCSRRSRFDVAGAHALAFGGQAKRRRRGGRPTPSAAGAYRIPVLCEAPRLAAAIAELRARPRRRRWAPGGDAAGAGLTENQATSRSLQSLLGRALAADPVFRAAGRVHALRGVYACMCARLFEWDGDYSDALIAMGVLGHAGLGESLVYTPVHLGDAFAAEPRLGAAALDAAALTAAGAASPADPSPP